MTIAVRTLLLFSFVQILFCISCGQVNYTPDGSDFERTENDNENEPTIPQEPIEVPASCTNNYQAPAQLCEEVSPVCCGPQRAVVRDVLDGDTARLGDGTSIRYLLINSPEMNTSNDSDPECYAQIARDYNAQLVLNKEVVFEYDEECTDQYGRLLAYVRVNEGLVNQLMLEKGYAELSYFAPNDACKDEFESKEAQAKNNDLGLWGACD